MHEIVNNSFDKLIDKIKTNISIKCENTKNIIINELNNTRLEIKNTYSKEISDLYEDTFDDIIPKIIDYDLINKEL
jgi:hypothetical protein